MRAQAIRIRGVRGGHPLMHRLAAPVGFWYFSPSRKVHVGVAFTRRNLPKSPPPIPCPGREKTTLSVRQKSHFAPTQSGFHDGPFHPHRASYPLPLLNRTNQNKRRQLITLPGGVVRHGVLDFLVREREIIALAQLVLLNVVGIHQHHRNAGFLFQGVA